MRGEKERRGEGVRRLPQEERRKVGASVIAASAE